MHPILAVCLAVGAAAQTSAQTLTQTAPQSNQVSDDKPKSVAQQPPGAEPDVATAVDDAKPEVRTKYGILIGPTTTVVDGPIRDGVIDYYAALNVITSKGVTANSNAAAVFWQVLGGEHSFFDEVDADEFFKQLGVDRPKNGAVRWIEFADFVKQQKASRETSRFLRESQPWDLLHQPWAAEDYPLVAAWLKANEPGMQQLCAGLARPDWYTPVTRPKDNPTATLIEGQIAAQPPREIARALCAQAMLLAKQGSHREAWEHVVACHQLGRHVSHGPALIYQLVGIAIDGIASRTDVELLNLAPPVDVLSQMRTDLKRLRKLGATSQVLDRGERFMFLDAVVNLSVGRDSGSIFGGDPGLVLRKILGSPIDWNETLKMGNGYYDRIVANASLPTREARDAASAQFSSDLKKLMADRPTPLGMAAILISGNVDKRLGKEIGRILISLLLPATDAGRSAETRGRVTADLSIVAVALAEHRSKHGRFPASLDKLAAVPRDDRFSGKPLKYALKGRGCIVYSVGRDLNDDEGRPLDGNRGDLVVHLK